VERDALKSLELDKIGGLLGGSVANELRRLELERASWMAAVNLRRNGASDWRRNGATTTC
jgi:hypothetical protein